MARIRTVKPDFWRDEDLSKVSAEAALLAIGLLNHADDEGYFNANPKLIESDVFPLRELSGSVTVLIEELRGIGYVKVFSGSDGKRYGHVVNFEKHQVINKKNASKIKGLCLVPEECGSPTVVLPVGMERKGREKEGKRDSAEPQSDSTPAIVSVPLVDKTEYGVTQAEIDEWSQAYPAVNVVQQLREMRAWSLANTAQRKTRRGFHAFVVRWLAKEQDKSGGRPATFAQQAADVARQTVPSKEAPDAALQKIIADGLRAVPPPDGIRAKLAQLRGAT